MLHQEHAPVQYVDTAAALDKVCAALTQKTAFAFDTEFDRFYREYGFKLSLLQIFDGHTVYLVDPIALKDLQLLWPFFEDPKICKVAYSCSEDIQILKLNGCNPVNIYDIQIAAKLCNHPANSLSDLMRIEFGIEADKTLQRSNWLRRPLSRDQLRYAGDDVSRLLLLKDILEATAEKRGVSKMIEEDNKACEKIAVTEFRVKLAMHHKRKFSPSHQQALLDLMHWRNDLAQRYNVPPANIVSDNTLESIIEDKSAFLAAPFTKGFSKRFAEDSTAKMRLMALVKDIQGEHIPKVAKEKMLSERQEESFEKEETEFSKKYLILYNAVIDEYGKESGEYILRGYKKFISSPIPQPNKLKEYQLNIINAMCTKLGLQFEN